MFEDWLHHVNYCIIKTLNFNRFVTLSKNVLTRTKFDLFEEENKLYNEIENIALFFFLASRFFVSRNHGLIRTNSRQIWCKLVKRWLIEIVRLQKKKQESHRDRLPRVFCRFCLELRRPKLMTKIDRAGRHGLERRRWWQAVIV